MTTNMEELRSAARAYFNNSTIEIQNYARQFFGSMDTNGDGVISSVEFGAFLRRNGYDWVGPNMFTRLDANRDGRLDFWEAMAFYYLIKTRSVRCDACRALLPGLYFTCVVCFDHPGGNTFDLCSRCYGGSWRYRFNHRHNAFVDSYVLLRSKTGIAPGMNVNLAVVRPRANDNQPAGFNRWFRALERAMAIAAGANAIGNLVAGCTIM